MNIHDILDKITSFFLLIRDEDEDFELDDDIQIEEQTLSSEEENKKDQKLNNRQRNALIGKGLIAALVICLIIGFYLYNRVHTFTDYVITASYENQVVSGTGYESVGKNIYRYNSDGISCVNRKNEMKWSITFNMQAPIVDICGDVMVVAEQQGNQVYVVNKNGLMGNFETLLPILKVRVSRQGVVAAVLQEDDVTWVNMYECDGTPIASDKTTVGESGYPMDIDLSPNGQKLAVSYLGVKEGIMQTDVVFYHFGTAGQSKENHIVGKFNYPDRVIPELYFTENDRAVAVADDGFIVFQGNNSLEESERVTFENEIISTFHDDDRIGFLFRSPSEDYTWRMELYNYHGRRKLSKDLNASFDHIKLQNGQILMYNDYGCDIFTTAGYKRFSSLYEKEIVNIFYFNEFRRYLVITTDSFDRIRIS